MEYWRAGRLKAFGGCFVDSERRGLWNDWRVGEYTSSEGLAMTRSLGNIWMARRRKGRVGHGAELFGDKPCGAGELGRTGFGDLR